MYQPTALEIYGDVLRHKLDRDVEVRPDGLVIKPNLFWLVAVRSCFISDKNIPINSPRFQLVCFTTRFLILSGEIRH